MKLRSAESLPTSRNPTTVKSLPKGRKKHAKTEVSKDLKEAPGPIPRSKQGSPKLG